MTAEYDDPVLQQPLHQPFFERRAHMPCAAHERRIALTEQMLFSLKETNEGLATKMDLLLAQMTKVALLEERNIAQQIDLTRAHARIEANTAKLDALSEESRAFMNYSKGQSKIIWALCSAVAVLLVKALIFAANHGMTP